VYAAAAGTATVGFDAAGYGNYVLVTHSNGYKTRYAHLQSVNVVNNQAVTTQTVVGFVGSTGSASSAPHLHFGYQTTSGGANVSYCNRVGGCPNGEAARSPQTQKPSPMQTNLGSSNITDFGCFQGPP
jgi:murein DD-endopeptidase MepM/ murein hydrolase activator NlpD